MINKINKRNQLKDGLIGNFCKILSFNDIDAEMAKSVQYQSDKESRMCGNGEIMAEPGSTFCVFQFLTIANQYYVMPAAKHP